MTGLRALGFAVAALCAPVARAHASCSITLDGDAEVVDRVRAELGEFADGGACVAVWARCRQTGDQVEVDLHDELGRSSLHLFMSADGAAAFLVSWSRRPLPDRAPGAPPRLVEPRSSATPAPAPQDGRWRPEISVAYVAANGDHPTWETATAEIRKVAGFWRYGGGARVIAGSDGGTITVEVEAALGVQIALSPRVTAIGELFAGDGVVALSPRAGSEATYGDGGTRVGVRAGIVWQFSDPFGLELQWGYDVTNSWYPAPSAWARPSHIGLGVRWLP